MSGQVQCPNCGGYKVSLQNKTVIATEKQERPTETSTIILVVVMAVVSVVGFIGAISANKTFEAVWSGIFALFLIFGLYRTFQRKVNRIVAVPTLVEYDYKCEICGYKWTWRTDQPLPHVQVRPELIAKIESQRWKCIRCGNVNEGINSSCSYCYAPKM